MSKMNRVVAHTSLLVLLLYVYTLKTRVREMKYIVLKTVLFVIHVIHANHVHEV